jgi:uncharacterized membrane protein YqjE
MNAGGLSELPERGTHRDVAQQELEHHWHVSCLDSMHMDSKNPEASSTTSETLPELVTRLGHDVLTMVEARLALLKLEIVEDVQAIARQGLLMVLGGVLACAGLAMFCLSLGFVVATLLPADLGQPARYALGFGALALVALAVGVLVAWKSYRKMRQRSIRPERSLRALEDDKRWLGKRRVS